MKHKDRGQPAQVNEEESALFEKILEAGPAKPAWPTGEPFVAECVDARHPTLQGRVQIRLDPDGPACWVPALQGLAIRKGDRLLLQVPHGQREPIAIGVVDGFLPRPEPERSPAARIEVKRDETFQVCSEEGSPLVEIVHDAKGPVVRLLQSDTRVELAGKLSIRAAELELKADKGPVRIETAEDVIVLGEIIKLN